MSSCSTTSLTVFLNTLSDSQVKKKLKNTIFSDTLECILVVNHRDMADVGDLRDQNHNVARLVSELTALLGRKVIVKIHALFGPLIDVCKEALLAPLGEHPDNVVLGVLEPCEELLE